MSKTFYLKMKQKDGITRRCKLMTSSGKKVLIVNDGEIPSSYQEVEWIKSSGTQWIDTEVIPTLDYTVECKAIKAIGYSLFGSGTNGFTFTGTSINYAYIGGSSQLSVTCGDQTVSHIWKITNRTAYCDTNSSSRSSGTTQPSLSMALFARKTSASGVNDGGTHTMYYCKIWDNNSTLVRNFIPCYRISDSVIGLYDTVSNRFFTNNGTGTFTKGNDV